MSLREYYFHLSSRKDFISGLIASVYKYVICFVNIISAETFLHWK